MLENTQPISGNRRARSSMRMKEFRLDDVRLRTSKEKTRCPSEIHQYTQFTAANETLLGVQSIRNRLLGTLRFTSQTYGSLKSRHFAVNILTCCDVCVFPA